MINKILAIQNCGPSGTTLMQSLLDGHPDIISLPGLHGQQLLVFWDKYQHLARDAFFQQFQTEFYHYYEPAAVPNDLGLRELGDHKNELALIDKTAFLNNLAAQWQSSPFISSKLFVTSVYLAYHQTLGRTVSDNAYLLYPIHSLKKKYASILVNDFDTVKFLHMVREPLQSIGSAAKHINKYEHWDHHYLLSCISAQMVSDFTLHVGPHPVHGMKPYFKDTPDGRIQSRALKLETLHADPKASMQKLCDWLNMAWHDNLLHSTFNGKSWHNRPESIRQSGTGQAVLAQKHADILPSFDRYRFEHLIASFNNHFGYENNPTVKTNTLTRLTMAAAMLLPFKMELLRDRWKRQLDSFRARKARRRLTKYIPNFIDKPIIIARNTYHYLACRWLWLLPPMLKQNKTTLNYVELLK
jgi:hypothetical protein